MSAASRRAVLAAVVGLGAVAAVAAPAAAQASELDRLAAEWDQLEEQINRLEDAAEAIHIERLYPAKPDALRWRKEDMYRSVNPNEWGEFVGWRDYLRFRDSRNEEFRMNAVALERFRARQAEICAAWESWEDECAEVRRITGYQASLDRQADLSDRQTAIEHRSMELTATTATGRAFKARLVRRYGDIDTNNEFIDRLTRSLVNDVLAAGAA